MNDFRWHTWRRRTLSPLSFFCHFISLNISADFSKNAETLDPWSSISAVWKIFTFVSWVRYSHISGIGNTICSRVRSWRTIWKKILSLFFIDLVIGISGWSYFDLCGVLGVMSQSLFDFRISIKIDGFEQSCEIFVVLSELMAQDIDIMTNLWDNLCYFYSIITDSLMIEYSYLFRWYSVVAVERHVVNVYVIVVV